ncbi:hypothetical protein DY000_02015906 [Brassica cretica]|uniref:Uncharacterized protein n=1 Tax=Brassica cretica TaxID=69181 RepID=A0ABQ7CX30_BRACR|nr:hypothetical protein DY000_02015906 [Brassica cretica]
MHGINPTLPNPPDVDAYSRDEFMELMKKFWQDQDTIFEDFYNKIDANYYPLNNSIAWISKTMEELRRSWSIPNGFWEPKFTPSISVIGGKSRNPNFP